jgi:hypothetical protein
VTDHRSKEQPRCLSVAEVGDAFFVDGSWRDVYVLKTGTAEWDTMLRWLEQEYGDAVRYSFEGLHGPIPASSSEIFASRESGSPWLEVDLEGLILKCHFFSSEEIEFDLDPKEVNDFRFRALQHFMRSLGTLLGKSVLVTQENRQMSPVLVYITEINRIVTIGRVDREEWES